MLASRDGKIVFENMLDVGLKKSNTKPISFHPVSTESTLCSNGNKAHDKRDARTVLPAHQISMKNRFDALGLSAITCH